MSLLADIAHGETDTADWFFLLAAIFAVVAAVFYAVAQQQRPNSPDWIRWAPVMLSLAVGCAAAGFLVL